MPKKHRPRLAIGDLVPPSLIKKIENPSSILRAIGMHIAEESREAWKSQSYGGIPWPEQYEGMSDFIHIAGALGDLEKGPNIKMKRYERQTPELVDTGYLRRSIGYNLVDSKTVEAGVTKNVVDYATEHAEVGGSSQKVITPTIRQNLFKVMQKSRGKVERAGKKHARLTKAKEKDKKVKLSKKQGGGVMSRRRLGEEIQSAAGSEKVARGKHSQLQSLGFIFSYSRRGGRPDEYEQDIAWRPFIGITDRTRKMIPLIIKAALEGKKVTDVGSL